MSCHITAETLSETIADQTAFIFHQPGTKHYNLSFSLIHEKTHGNSSTVETFTTRLPGVPQGYNAASQQEPPHLEGKLRFGATDLVTLALAH